MKNTIHPHYAAPSDWLTSSHLQEGRKEDLLFGLIYTALAVCSFGGGLFVGWMIWG
jgi:hypothetical protein